MQYGSDSAGFGRLSASGLPSLNHAPPGNTPPSPLTGWYCWAKPPIPLQFIGWPFGSGGDFRCP